MTDEKTDKGLTDKRLLEQIVKHIVTELGLTNKEDMRKFLNDMKKGYQEMQDKMREELESVVKDYSDQRIREYDEFKGFIRSKIEKVEEGWKKFQERPLEHFSRDMDREFGIRIQEKLSEGSIKRVILRQLAAYVVDLAEKENMLEGAVAKAMPLIEQELVKKLSKEEEIYGAKDLGDVIRKIKKKTKMEKIAWWAISAIAGASLILASYGVYNSNRTTAEGAAGVANQALAKTKEFQALVESYKNKTEEAQRAYEINDNERKTEIGNLERSLLEQIKTRATTADVANLRKEHGERITDSERNYQQLQIGFEAEARKNEGRDTAYSKFNEFLILTSKGLSELQTRFTKLEMESAKREYVDNEIKQIKGLYDVLGNKLLDWDTNFKILDANSKDFKELKTNYEGLRTNYNLLGEKIKKIEESQPKKKEN